MVGHGCLEGIDLMAKRWSPEEQAIVKSLASEYPTSLIQKKLKGKGYERSRKSIQDKMSSLKLTLRVSASKWLSRPDFCAHLECTEGKLRAAMRNKQIASVLEAKKIDNKWFFPRSGIIKLAKCKPGFFAGVSRDNLFYLLEDMDLVEKIATEYPYKFSDFRVRSSDGTEYRSATHASKFLGVSRWEIMRSIKDGRSVLVFTPGKRQNLTFERIGDTYIKLRKHSQSINHEN